MEETFSDVSVVSSNVLDSVDCLMAQINTEGRGNGLAVRPGFLVKCPSSSMAKMKAHLYVKDAPSCAFIVNLIGVIELDNKKTFRGSHGTDKVIGNWASLIFVAKH